MSHKNRLLVLAVMPLLFSCSNSPTSWVRFTGYAYDYTSSRISEPLVFPPDVHPVKQDNLYPVPAVQTEGKLGQAVSLVPPSLLLAGDEGSSVVKVNGRSNLLLELPSDSLWALVQQFTTEQNIPVQDASAEERQLLTDWVEWQDKSFWHRIFGSSEPKAKRERYLIEVVPGPNPTNALLSWEQVARQEMAFGQDDWLNVDPSLSDETALINEFLDFYRSKQPKKLSIRQDGSLELELSQSSAGNPLYLLNQNFLSAWELAAKSLPLMGFKVSDRDQSLGSYFVDYDGPENSWKFWKKSEYPELPLAKQSYKIQLGELGSRTSISVLNEKDVSLSMAEMQELLPFFMQAINQANGPKNDSIP